MKYTTMAELIALAEENDLSLWQVASRCDALEKIVAEEKLYAEMTRLWRVMIDSAADYDGDLRSDSGLVGGDGQRMAAYTEQALAGSFMGAVMAQALAVGECNACMKRVVAAPTAGSCGVLPAVLIPLFQERGIGEERIVQGLFVAAAIGTIIATNASISGAEGGCQAEVGSAAAMAAGALVSIMGGTPRQVGHSVAIALKNLLGLVCDPVAGLVEVPCVKRGVIGAVNAVSAADMALAGIESRIPADEVILAMDEVGREMSPRLKETAQGGLAATPTGQRIAAGEGDKIF